MKLQRIALGYWNGQGFFFCGQDRNTIDKEIKKETNDITLN
jgi:hypothetical protein